MRKLVTILSLEVAAIVGSTVVTMIWPTMDRGEGLVLLSICAALAVVGILVWIWPAEWFPSIGRHRGYMTPTQVVRYMADESGWGRKVRLHKKRDTLLGLNVEWRKNPRFVALDEFPDRACEQGKIRAHGLLNGQGAPVEIPPSFWLTNSFAVTGTITGQENRTAPRQYAEAGYPFYTAVHIERADVEKTWPR